MRSSRICIFICFLFASINFAHGTMYFDQDSINLDSLRVHSYTEGPHIFWRSENQVEVFYIKHDSIKDKSRLISRLYTFRKDTLTFKGFGSDKGKVYRIPKIFEPDSSQFSPTDRIVVLGDIHGEYRSLTNLLKYNGVIDDQENWSFGDGHLVFTGDVFDRGQEVTECLWLIFRLELQARSAGGHVHYLLGNHETMALLYDNRYVHPKYLHACHFLQTHYSLLFGKNSILGQWLRNKNTLIKVGKILFVHGGISPLLLEKRLSIQEINKGMRYHINNYLELKDTTMIDLYLYTHSPVWYRGYVSRTPYYPRTTLREVLSSLDFYNVMVIVFGHTPVARIYPMYSYQLIAMDVPIGDPNFEDQGLLIQNQEFFRIFTNREKEKL